LTRFPSGARRDDEIAYGGFDALWARSRSGNGGSSFTAGGGIDFAIGGGELLSGVVDVYPGKRAAKKITVTRAEICA